MRRVLLWTLASLVVMAALGYSMYRRYYPWEEAWRLPGARENRGFPSYVYPVRWAAFSPDGSRVLVTRLDGAAEIRDAESGRLVRTFGVRRPVANHSEGPHHVQWSADGRRIALAYGDVQVYDAHTGRLLFQTPDFNNPPMALSPDGRWLAVKKGRWGESIAVFDVDDRRRVFEAPKEERRFTWFTVWSPDSSRLFGYDTIVRAWSAGDWRELYTLNELDLVHEPYPHFADADSGFAGPTFPDPSRVDRDEFGHLFNKHFSEFHVTCAQSAAVSPDGSILGVGYGPLAHTIPMYGYYPGDSRLRLYDAATGELTMDRVLQDPPAQVVFSNDGTKIALTNGETCRIVPLRPEADIVTFDTEGVYVYRNTFAWSHDDRYVYHGRYALWRFDAGTGRAVRLTPYTGENRFAVSPVAHRIVTVFSGGGVAMWRPTREPSARGCWALPETWGLLAAGPVTVLGIFWLSRRRDVPIRRWPKPLVTTLVGAGIGLGLVMSFIVLPRVMESAHYKRAPDFVAIAMRMVSLAPAVLFGVGLCRLSEAIRIFVIGFAILALFLASIAAAERLGDFTGELSRDLPDWFFNGWPPAAYIAAIGAAALSIFTLYTLTRKPTAELYRGLEEARHKAQMDVWQNKIHRSMSDDENG